MELRLLPEAGAAVVLEFCPAIADMIELIRACWLVCAACPGDAEAPAAAAVWAGAGVAVDVGSVNGVDAAAEAVGAAAGVTELAVGVVIELGCCPAAICDCMLVSHWLGSWNCCWVWKF